MWCIAFVSPFCFRLCCCNFDSLLLKIKVIIHEKISSVHKLLSSKYNIEAKCLITATPTLYVTWAITVFWLKMH